MGTTLQAEIKQTAPFPSLREEALLNLMRTAAAAGHGWEQHLRPFGLSTTQYNVLRILRGAGAGGLCQYEIAERLVARVPDVPRILERMERLHWIRRERGTTDRRLMVASLTPAGRALVDELDPVVERSMTAAFPRLNDTQLRQLNELLAEARREPDVS